MTTEPKCTCAITDPKTWTTYGSAVEPGSQMEPDPDCPVHFPLIEKPTTIMRGILSPNGFVPTTDWEPIVAQNTDERWQHYLRYIGPGAMPARDLRSPAVELPSIAQSPERQP